MSNMYLLIMLIGIPCVFFWGVVGLIVKIYLTNARWEISREKKQKDYEGKIKHYRCIRKILIWTLAISIVTDVIFCVYNSTDNMKTVDDGQMEQVKKVYNDPKDRLEQKTEVEIKEIFIDYFFFLMV